MNKFIADNIALYHVDNMELMAKYKDNYFDLAIVDPPYGMFDQYSKIERTGGTWSKKYGKKIKLWDSVPDKKYFDELFRVSKYQIIFGGNYFNLPISRNFIIWRKTGISEKFSMAMVEYAWTSIIGNAKIYEAKPQGKPNNPRIHPTQKPVKLYKWLLKNYAKQGDKILDTHLGSGSIAIACDDMGFSLTACEIDQDYFNAAVKRLKRHQDQFKIFAQHE